MTPPQYRSFVASAIPTPGTIYFARWLPHGFDIFYVHFALAIFDISLFKKAGIDLPLRIASSVAKRQAEFYFGRLCSRAALESLAENNTQVGTGVFREPLWPPGYTGSITHDHSIAAAVSVPEALCAGIGIDIETICKADDGDALRAFTVNKRELSRIEAHRGSLGLHTLLTLVFSAKESFYKGVFGMVQRMLDFDAIEFLRVNQTAQTLRFETKQHLGGGYMPEREFEVHFKLLDDTHVITMFIRDCGDVGK